MGWATVVAYVLATILALLTLIKGARRQRFFWFVLTALLFLLAINKQLDLQSALTAAGRCLANAQGWYDNRRVVQVIFISAIAMIALITALTLAWTMRRDLGRIWLALVGVIFLLAFVAIRAAGFHHFDWFIGYQVAGIRMNWILELGGITLIAANALFLLLRRPQY